MKRIYLDHAATTPLDPEVLREMGPYFSQDFGNPSSVYAEGQRGREAIDDARQEIARILECSLEEIIFVSSATEGNNFALKGVLEAWRKSHKGLPHLITSSIEHSSVLTTAELLAENGQAEVTFLPVTNEGLLRPEDLKAALQENTALVSLQYVNNEIGAIQPISRLGKICAKSNIPFHVDAVQGAGIVPLSVEILHADLLTLSAHKFYGPKGVGLLFVRRGTEILPQITGGGQERKYRSGTENVPGIVGMAKALIKAEKIRTEEVARLRALQEYGLELMQKEYPQVEWNGPAIGSHRSPANLHFGFGELDGESLLIRLDLNGIAASLGSACSSGVLDPSHVLSAIGVPPEKARSGLRLTLGRHTTKEELTTAIPLIANVVRELQKEQEFS